MLTAITGTPGVGKTTVSEILRRRGHKVIDLNEIIEKNDLIVGYDEKKDTKIVDMDALDSKILDEFDKDDSFIEGHLSHLLPIDRAIILRCNPIELETRLRANKWSDKKIKENVDAEILDSIKIEAYESLDSIFEVDTSGRSPEEIANAIEEILKDDYEQPKIDWLEKYEYLLFKG